MKDIISYDDLQNNRKFIIPFIFGILGYFFMFLIPLVIQGYFEQHLWNKFFLYNHYLNVINIFQRDFLLFGGSIVVGYFAIQNLGSEIKTHSDAINVAIISGLTTGFLYSLITIAYPYITIFHLIARNVIVDVFIQLLITIIIIILFQLIGAFLNLKWNEKRKLTQLSQQNKNITIRFLLKILLLFLTILILPIIIVYVGIWAGIIDWRPGCDLLSDQISIERINENTVKITQNTQSDCFSLIQNSRWFPQQKSPFWNLIVNGKNMSNISIIKEQGLPDIIDPPYGLVYQEGSVVSLNGPDIFANRTHFSSFKIIEYLPSGIPWSITTMEI